MKQGWINKPGYSTKLLADQISLSSQSTQIELVKFGQGKYKHFHKQKTEFFYFIEGSGEAIIEGKNYKINPGSFFLIKPFMIHTWVNKSAKPLVALMVKTNNSLDDTFTE